MMDLSSLSFREEVLDYLRSSEGLLAALSEPRTSRFSKEELDVLAYSVTEVQKILVVLTTQ